MPSSFAPVLGGSSLILPQKQTSRPFVRPAKPIRRPNDGLRLGEVIGRSPVFHCEANSDRHAVLHDFCMSIPFGGVAMVAGLACCVMCSSSTGVPIASMGALILASSFLSLKAWKKRSSSLPFTLTSAGLTAGILSVGWRCYHSASSKLAPIGLLTTASAMLLFLIYNVLAGGNPPPKTA